MVAVGEGDADNVDGEQHACLGLQFPTNFFLVKFASVCIQPLPQILSLPALPGDDLIVIYMDILSTVTKTITRSR